MDVSEMDIERYKSMGGYNYWTEIKINSNQYILTFSMPDDETSPFDSLFVDVWATPTGEYHEPPEDPHDLGTTIASKRTPHEKVYKETVQYGRLDKDYGSFSSFISDAINEAVCIVENKADKTQQMKDQVRAALEANKEVHGGLDYEIEQAKETED